MRHGCANREESSWRKKPQHDKDNVAASVKRGMLSAVPAGAVLNLVYTGQPVVAILMPGNQVCASARDTLCLSRWCIKPKGQGGREGGGRENGARRWQSHTRTLTHKGGICRHVTCAKRSRLQMTSRWASQGT
jgi:hypothetical protein